MNLADKHSAHLGLCSQSGQVEQLSIASRADIDAVVCGVKRMLEQE